MTRAAPGEDSGTHPWTCIRAGDNQVILAVDFPATGRPEASFADLVSYIPTCHGVWEIGLPESDSSVWSARKLVRWWTDDVRARRVEVMAVMGFCASSPYALALAREFRDERIPPQVILVDPTTVDREILCEFGFIRVIELFRGLLGSDEFEAAVVQAKKLCDIESDLPRLAAALSEAYLDTARLAFAHARVSAVQAEELSSIVTRYLDYLRVAAELGTDLATDDATAIRSADYPGSMIVGDSVFSPIFHNSILAEEWTGRAVASILEGRKQ